MLRAGLRLAGGCTVGVTVIQQFDRCLPRVDVLAAADPDRTLFECAEIRRHCALFGEAPPAWSVTGMCRIHLFMQEAERALQQFLASKTLADLGREFERKAPEQYLRDAESWFQLRRSERAAGRRRTASARSAKRAAPPDVKLTSKRDERKR